MDNKPNILLIAYTFPPIPYGGTYRSLRLCKRFAEMGINLHVLTLSIYDDIPNDFDMLKKVPKSVKIHRIPILDPLRLYRLRQKRLLALPFFRLFNKVISLLLRMITIPDHMVLWNLNAIPAALKIIDKYKIDTVIVSSPPDSSLFIGYAVKKLRNIKWIADLRDPIVGNVAAVDLLNNNDFISIATRRFLIFFNNLVVKNADWTIANTKSHLAELKREFPERNIKTVRNTYDEDDFSGPIGLKFNKFTISHLGSYYGLRSAKLLFNSIKKLEKDISPEELNLQVLFYGLHDTKLVQEAKEYNVEKYVRISGIVPHREAIQIMRASHLLLLIKATGKGALGQIPGKFFEYVGSQNKILCIGPEDSEVSEIIEANAFGRTVEDDEQKTFQILKDYYFSYLSGETLKNRSDHLTQFASHAMAEKILSVIV